MGRDGDGDGAVEEQGIVIIAFYGLAGVSSKELVPSLYHPISCALFYVSRHLHSADFCMLF